MGARENRHEEGGALGEARETADGSDRSMGRRVS